MSCGGKCSLLMFGLCACFVAVLTSASEGTAGRELSFAMIAGYEPASDVTQHNRIDLDQKEMEEHLKVPDYAKAKLIYTLGGNSGGYAEMSVSALSAVAAKGTVVTQPGNAAARGKIKKAASIGATLLTVSYDSVCKEGGSSSPDTSGCFTAAGGDLTVGSNNVGSPSTVQNKYRTIAGFSTAAQSKMAGQEFYAVYRAYYNHGDYSHRMVIDALDRTNTCSTCDDAARVQIAKKTSAYLGIWMYVVREMEDAIMDCQNGCLTCNDDPVHAWDEAVAFYAGSLEGTTGPYGTGKLLHELADKRCRNFGTCGAGGSTGTAQVNIEIFDQFKRGQSKLLQGKCVEAIPIKRRIVQLMSVPMVQGTLRYAYKVDKLSGGSKEKAEGVAFAAAILPRLAACDVDAAGVVNDNMKYIATTTSFTSVKQAFESNYACLGITCEDVGGLILSGTEYYELAAPCVTANPTVSAAADSKDDGPPTALIIVIIVVSVFAVVMVLLAVLFFMQANKYKELSKSQGGRSNVPAGVVGSV